MAAQKRKIDEDKENDLTELPKKIKTSSESNERDVKETDSNQPTTSASAAESNNEAQEKQLENPQILANITNTEEQTTVDDETKEAQAEIDREKELSDTYKFTLKT